MKKILALSLAALLALSFMSCNKSDETEDAGNDAIMIAENKIEYDDYDLTYAVNESGNYEITGIIYDGDETISVSVPDEIDDRPVTGIADSAFKAVTALDEIDIPDSIEYIGNFAFYGCTGITEITIPDTVNTIGKGAFQCCAMLTKITLPATLKVIDDYTFFDCKSLAQIALPETLTDIGAGAFWSCDALKSVTVPASVKAIGDAAFIYCDTLETITVNSADATIGEWALGEHESGITVKAPAGSTAQAHTQATNTTFEPLA